MLINRIKISTKIAWSFLGRPYIWGGDDPIAGFDCSGFCIEILKSVGVLPRRGDWTAEQLRDKFFNMRVQLPHEGCLVFYRGHLSEKIVHVEYCLNEMLSIGASGGGSRTQDEDDAIVQNAYIKIREIYSRNGVWGFVNPFKGIE